MKWVLLFYKIKMGIHLYFITTIIISLIINKIAICKMSNLIYKFKKINIQLLAKVNKKILSWKKKKAKNKEHRIIKKLYIYKRRCIKIWIWVKIVTKKMILTLKYLMIQFKMNRIKIWKLKINFPNLKLSITNFNSFKIKKMIKLWVRNN